MPLTRAQRVQASPDIATTAVGVPLPATPPVTRRKPLGEISGNQEDLPAPLDDPEVTLKSKKGPEKGKGKKGKIGKKHKENHGCEEVIPDENKSEGSSAVEDACNELLNPEPQGMSQVVMHDERPQSPPSPAVTAVTHHLSSKSMTQTHHLVAQEAGVDVIQGHTRSQAQAGTMEQGLEKTEDSTQLSIVNADRETNTSPSQRPEKSPQRVSPRAEDSIEAIDRFEEELEQVAELIPDVHNHAKESPKPMGRAKGASTTAPNRSRKTTGSLRTTEGSTGRPISRDPKSKGAATLKRGSSFQPPAPANPDLTKGRSGDHRASSSSSPSDARGPATARKRVSSVHKAPFVPAKSGKAPTRPNFELPGEAVARKLKAAREERMKGEEEEKGKPKTNTFKARPIRISQAPVVKSTATSKARISLAKGEAPAASVSAASAGKRLSTLSAHKRPTPGPTTANTSARVNHRVPSSNHPVSVNKARPSLQPSVRQSVTPADTALLKAKGKEVFNRGMVEHDERERMRKEKEEAARKARVEAAERGRQASRAWAERQKAKKMGTAKGKEQKENVETVETNENGQVETGDSAVGGEASVSS
ncbi:MAG: hypothetical protein LQ350_002959 [Teloschistes chrysophthalmus]|nr:MAG: hypothetical protein LQ350_002959 [Niorma chrysophthalma]